MPKVRHSRSFKGCDRCKLRKVKCDEVSPECGACQRHGAICSYASPATIRSTADRSTRPSASSQLDSTSPHGLVPLEGSDTYSARTGNVPSLSNEVLQPRTSQGLLELRLLHNFCFKTGQGLTTLPYIWAEAGPLTGLTHQFLLDACFAASALHLSRVSSADEHLAEVSASYFERAITGHGEAQIGPDVASRADALFLATGLISFYALARTGNPVPNENDSMLQWLQLGKGSRIIYVAYNLHPKSELARMAIEAPPDLMNDTGIFDPANITEKLQVLLEWGADFEVMTDEDRKSYAETLSYISLIYKSAERGEKPLHTCRRLLGMPSRVPERFHTLVIEKRPRALVMLAYLFAAFELVGSQVWWTCRIAERHVASIYRLLPNGWKPFMEEPLMRAGLNAADFSGSTNNTPTASST